MDPKDAGGTAYGAGMTVVNSRSWGAGLSTEWDTISGWEGREQEGFWSEAPGAQRDFCKAMPGGGAKNTGLAQPHLAREENVKKGI